MEIAILLIFVFLIGLIIFLLRKNHALKKDIYDFTHKLDKSLNILLNGRKLDNSICEQDDLWGTVYDKLYRISNLHTRKNQEITSEKENLKELVSDISHQIKTPLSNIKLYLEMLTDETALAENTETIEKMGKQVGKLDFLFQSMIKMSRLETGTIKIQKKRNAISDTLAAAIGAAIPKADKKNIQIHVEYDETHRLNHDIKWTGEAIFNILDNAVKYTESGGFIWISVEQGEIFTKISIKDTGKGIPLERHGTIFNRFYREPEVHDNEGVGIGLYLAREIVSMQNGYIEVQSEVGKGSIFNIYLPN
ncbi:MAG: HAMP domain-containing histidine kinase [Dorea sp.]|jgi:signal transduction histidine kinase|nr:HAMP domain-containing histidine kinase [Dorea sp.]MCI9248035.1 HAMP domain-containing histidine kinase [Dorea sp.]